jgi:hypothetical protein
MFEILEHCHDIESVVRKLLFQQGAPPHIQPLLRSTPFGNTFTEFYTRGVNVPVVPHYGKKQASAAADIQKPVIRLLATEALD